MEIDITGITKEPKFVSLYRHIGVKIFGKFDQNTEIAVVNYYAVGLIKQVANKIFLPAIMIVRVH